MAMLKTNQRILMGAAVIASIATWILTMLNIGPIIIFITSAVALASLAATVGEATEQLGEYLSPGATGVLQSALGNLPELFVCIFALRAGLVTVVQSALIGSILSNSLLVLGLAFVVGGVRHGVQRFDLRPPRMIATLTLLAVSAIVVPTLAFELHTPAAGHEDVLAIAVAIVLLLVFLASIPLSIQGGPQAVPHDPEKTGVWPIWLAVTILTVTAIGAAFVSDWFVAALDPAIKALHISEAFAGLVIVAIAGNAVENVVGIQLAARNKMDYAISVILNSSLQVALALTPVLVLVSFFVSATPFTLVMPPLLVIALFLAAILSAVIVFDGESNWLEGTALIGLYGIIAAAFWWG